MINRSCRLLKKKCPKINPTTALNQIKNPAKYMKILLKHHSLHPADSQLLAVPATLDETLKSTTFYNKIHRFPDFFTPKLWRMAGCKQLFISLQRIN
jgi:hypothetical protein